MNTLIFKIIKVIVSIILFFFVLILTGKIYNMGINISKYFFKKNNYHVYKDEKEVKKINLKDVFIAKLIVIFIYIVFFYLIFLYLGMDISLLLTTIGSIGLALALALKGTIANLMSGVLITVTNKYEIGDIIETSAQPGSGFHQGLIGQVIDFGFYNTQIKENGSYNIVTINNDLIWRANLSNYTRQPAPRYFIEITIAENNDLESMTNDVKNILKNNKYVHNKPNYFVNFKNNPEGVCTLGLLIIVYVDPKLIPINVGMITREVILTLTKKGYRINCSTVNNSNNSGTSQKHREIVNLNRNNKKLT